MMSWKELLNLLESELSNHLKKTNFYQFFIALLHFLQKMGLRAQRFQKLSAQKAWLLKPLKDSVSRQPSAVDVLTGLTHC